MDIKWTGAWKEVSSRDCDVEARNTGVELGGGGSMNELEVECWLENCRGADWEVRRERREGGGEVRNVDG